MVNLTPKVNFMKETSFNLDWPMIEVVFENPTVNCNEPRRSIVNSACGSAGDKTGILWSFPPLMAEKKKVVEIRVQY
jgi:hypothetical protein